MPHINNLAIFPFFHTPHPATLTLVPIATDNNISDNDLEKITLPYLTFSEGSSKLNFAHYEWQAVESLQVAWLIQRFNEWFSHLETVLVKGEHEPEYFAKTPDSSAKIVFAHGFFASSLHEISHWCVAGKKRRLLNDFGYWYAPDGRNAEQQHAFEQVEITPQAIECLLTLMCGKKFKVSQDNLFADFDTSQSTFAKDVENRAIQFFQNEGQTGEQAGKKLPSDARYLLGKLRMLRPLPLGVFDIKRNFFKP